MEKALKKEVRRKKLQKLTNNSNLNETWRNSSELKAVKVSESHWKSQFLPAAWRCNFSDVNRQNHVTNASSKALNEPRDINCCDVVCKNQDEKWRNEQQSIDQQRSFPSDPFWKWRKENSKKPANRQQTSNPRKLFSRWNKAQRWIWRMCLKFCYRWWWPAWNE